jgi:hypothetical protein
VAVRPQQLAALADRFDESRAYELVQRLAGEEFSGRQTGTAGSRAAGDFLVELLGSLGLEPWIDGFPVPAAPLLMAAPLLRIGPSLLEHRRDFAEHPRSGFVPTERSGLARDADTAGAGDWALIRAVPPGGGLDRLVADLVDRGVVGLLTPQYADASGFLTKRLLGGPPLPLPVVAVRPDLLATADGEPVTANAPLQQTEVTGRNIFFGPRWVPTEHAAPAVLVVAHYDGVGADPERHLPAAGDNATGVAVICEAARIIAEQPPGARPLLFAAVDAEELGAQGSRAHARALAAAGTPAVALNLDMAGKWHGTVAVELGGDSDELYAALDSAGRALDIPLAGAPVASDNRSYVAAGFPAAGLGLGAEHYHSPLDGIEHVDPAALRTAGRLVLGTVHQLLHPNP